MMDISINITCIIEEMDLTKLSKKELLEKCEELGITKCKSKNKGKLIELINQKQTTPDITSNITYIIEEMDLTKLSKTELLEKCEELGIKKCKSKNKGELINLLQNKPVEKKKD